MFARLESTLNSSPKEGRIVDKWKSARLSEIGACNSN